MEVFIKKPNIDMYTGIRVTKDTDIEYQNEKVTQSVKNLVFHTLSKVSGDKYESIYNTTIKLEEGDILIFEDEGRGYIMPVESFMTVEEAINELECIKDIKEVGESNDIERT